MEEEKFLSINGAQCCTVAIHNLKIWIGIRDKVNQVIKTACCIRVYEQPNIRDLYSCLFEYARVWDVLICWSVREIRNIGRSGGPRCVTRKWWKTGAVTWYFETAPGNIRKLGTNIGKLESARPNTSVDLRFVAQVIHVPGIRILTKYYSTYSVAQ